MEGVRHYSRSFFFLFSEEFKLKGFPPPFEKGGQGDLRGYPSEKSPSIPLFQRGKYHFHIWGDRI
jgi:hypothetical protein